MKFMWESVRLEEIAEKVTVGHVSSMASEYVEDGVPFFRSQDVQPNKLLISTTKFISEEFHQKLQKSSLAPGDVVVVRTGYPGTAAVVPDTVPVSNCADLVIIRPSHRVIPKYLTSLLKN